MARVRKLLAIQLKERPVLDFHGAFFTVAVKEGSSEIYHVDWHDWKWGYAYVIVFGDFEGGEFCAPQLGIKVPIRPGQIFCVMARVLAHCTAPVTGGRRLVITCFSDHNIIAHSTPLPYVAPPFAADRTA